MAERILFSYTRITVVSGRPERRREQQKPATKESSLRHRDGRGGVFDHSVALAYAESRHGVDGRLLDPILETFLKVYAPDATIADIGMGAGTVAIEAVKAGAKKVHGLDNSQAMLDQAAIAITQAEEQSAIAQDSISIVHGSAESLPYKNDSVDLALSVNVGCALPTDGIFAPHFSEMARIITPDGKIFVAAPTNFGEVFTSGSATKTDVLETIAQTLQEINTHPSSSDEVEHIQTLRQVVGRLGEINRATFVRRDNKFILVYNGEAPVALTKAELVIPESELVIGEPIERKLAGSEKSTGLVVPNYYHPRQEYLDAIQTAGLTIVNGDEINRAMIPEQRNQYNETLSPERQLGEEYLQHSPFDLYLLTRKQPSS